MKKFSKFAAVAAAMALLIAMSTSAFAAVNGSMPDPEAEKVSVGDVTTSDPAKAGGEIVGTAIPKNEQISEDTAKSIVKDKLGVTVKANEKLVIMDAVELDYVKDGKIVDLENGTVTFTMKAPVGAVNGAKVYVLHQLHNGSWEVKECVVDNGNITVELTGLSPVYLALIEQTKNNDTANTVKVKVSPKTGF